MRSNSAAPISASMTRRWACSRDASTDRAGRSISTDRSATARRGRYAFRAKVSSAARNGFTIISAMSCRRGRTAYRSVRRSSVRSCAPFRIRADNPARYRRPAWSRRFTQSERIRSEARALADFDVLIAGAGPAGSATAISLAAFAPALRVALIDSPVAAAPIGETLPPQIKPVLRHLDVWEAFASDGHLPSYRTVSAWGGAGL